jgi:hypothetical protein
LRLHLVARRARLLRIAGCRSATPTLRNRRSPDRRRRTALPRRWMPVHGPHIRQCAPGTAGVLPALRLRREWHVTLPARGSDKDSCTPGADVEGLVGHASQGKVQNNAVQKRARRGAPVNWRNNLQKQPSSARQTCSHRPKPADCIACREISDVDAIPCMRSLNSSAFDAFSRAVS